MANYDFHNLLSYLDFENLTQSLLEAELGITFENFRDGPDGGIDLRHASAGQANKTIVQCKRYKTYASLKAELLSSELAKIKALAPSRYILSTSVALSPKQVDELVELLSPHIVSSADVYSRDRLNHLLTKHPEVERRHVKLWATSAAVLDELLNGRSHAVSRDEVVKTISAAKFYVKNSSFDEALTILDKHRVCLISGHAGIGKTTLARQLLLYYLERGFEIVKIDGDISEARDRNVQTKPRFYYYDDFLGQTGAADKFNKNEDQKLIDFMHSVRESKGSVLVLTTREYILNQARLRYEKIDREKFDHRTCIIDLAKYSRRIRSQILYNHLHFSRLPGAYVQQIITTRSYLPIVDHDNYNPRLIESLTSPEWIGKVSVVDYPTFFLATLENPTEIWNHAFRQQLSTAARHLLLVLTTLRRAVRLDDLRTAFSAFHEAECRRLCTPRTAQDFLNALKELDGTFVHTSRVDEQTVIEFSNPSIRDFLQNIIAAGEWLPALIEMFVFFEQPQWLVSIEQDDNSKLPKEEIRRYAVDIAGAMRRTFTNSSCTIYVLGREMWRRIEEVSEDLTLRLATCISYLREHAPDEVWIADKLQWLAAQVKQQKIRPHQFADTLEDFISLNVFETDAGHTLANSLKDIALSSPDSMEEFEGLAILLKHLPATFSWSEKRTAASAYSDFAERYAADHDIDGPDEIRQAASQLEELGRSFGVDVREYEESMREQAEEKEKEMTWDRDDDERRGSSAGSSDVFQDTDLDSMFRTLRQ